jgi:hypothetical protein
VVIFLLPALTVETEFIRQVADEFRNAEAVHAIGSVSLSAHHGGNITALTADTSAGIDPVSSLQQQQQAHSAQQGGGHIMQTEIQTVDRGGDNTHLSTTATPTLNPTSGSVSSVARADLGSLFPIALSQQPSEEEEEEEEEECDTVTVSEILVCSDHNTDSSSDEE